MAEKIKDPGVQRYLDVMSTYDREFKRWEGRVEKIIKRYRDDRMQTTSQSHYNILWSNVQTLKAATFSRMPKADVSRRFKDNDPVGRVASMLLERALDFEITHSNDFEETLTACVYDRFLGGRGSSWIRYEPVIETMESESEESISEDDIDDRDNEYLDIETTPVDYVHWKDFGHEVARSWDEVTMVWRKVYMTRGMLRDRFPDWADKIPLDSSPDDQKMKQTEGVGKRALIVELWNKETNKVCWLSISLGKVIDERDDPLGIEGFWPCPKPLFATMTNETLVPVPDFTLYQDQAGELDVLTDRIQGLINALKVRGVYDASTPELARLFTEGDNNTLIPVKNYSAFAEKGGMNGAINLVDIRPIAEALGQAYQAMGQVKQQIYDITGISDIIRGASVASETATAQQIKGQYATLRLKTFQDDVAKFASAILKIKAQIICQHFQPETIVKIGGAAQMSQDDQQLVPQAIELLKNNPMRTFRVEVLADSMVLANESQEKQDRVEFLSAASSFLERGAKVAQQAPSLVPLMMDMLKFGVTGFRVGRSLEGQFDSYADEQQAKQKQAQLNPPPPQPNPEMMKAQAEAQRSQAEAQMAQAKMQQEAQLEQVKLQLAQQEAATKSQMESQRLEFEKWKTQLDNDTKVLIAELSSKTDLHKTALNINATNAEGLTEISTDGVEQPTSALQGLVDSINNNMQMLVSVNQQHNMDLAMQQQQAHQALIEQMTKPKQVIRDANGKIAGVA
jgi:hypothetical protein